VLVGREECVVDMGAAFMRKKTAVRDDAEGQ